MNWAISEVLPEGDCRHNFETFLSSYIELLTEDKKPEEALHCLSYSLYEMVQKLDKMSAQTKDDKALKFVNTIVKALSADSNLEEKV